MPFASSPGVTTSFQPALGLGGRNCNTNTHNNNHSDNKKKNNNNDTDNIVIVVQNDSKNNGTNASIRTNSTHIHNIIINIQCNSIILL